MEFSGRQEEGWKTILAMVVSILAAGAFLFPVLSLVWQYVWEPLRLRRIMIKQGLRGPPYRPVFGNLIEGVEYGESFPESLPLDDNHYDSTPTVMPQYDLFFPKYGKRFLYMFGNETRLVVRDPQIAKTVLFSNDGSFMRSPMQIYIVSRIVGRLGLFAVEGEKWAHYRRILNPFFFQESLKGMVKGMVKGAIEDVQKWDQLVMQEGGFADVNVEPGIQTISGKIIGHTAFSDHSEAGERIVKLQAKLVSLLYETVQSTTFYIPGWSLLPTKRNKEMEGIEFEVDRLLMEVIEARREAIRKGEHSSYGNDILGRLVSASEGSDGKLFNLKSIFNTVKNLYFAGQDTVANVTCFAILLLARHSEWQELARKEILEVCGAEEAFDLNKLNRLKDVEMIVNETMRLFGVVPSVTKVATKDMHLGDLFVPKGLAIEIAVHSMHLDPDLWGEDVHKFKPERFAGGVLQACKHPQAFLPFSTGPRICIGNNFAMMEAKILLSMMLRRFELLPSLLYKHHPHFDIVQRPRYGMYVILKALNCTSS